MVKQHREERVRAWCEAENIGGCIGELVRTVGAQLIDVTPLSPLASPLLRRGSFRLRFANGCVFKACRFESNDRCRRVHDLLEEIEPGYFPRVLSRHGPFMLVEWVKGRALPPIKPRRAILEAIGCLQGVIHRTRPPVRYERLSEPTEGRELALLEGWLKELRDLAAMSRQEAGVLIDLARRFCPGSWSVGLVHGDLCGENVLVSRAGQPVAIDFETLDIDALDFDLARTWYRWPVSRRQRQAYLDGYRRYRNIDHLEHHFVYWAIRATLQSAVFRVCNATPGQDVPLAVLRKIIQRAGPSKDLFLQGARG